MPEAEAWSVRYELGSIPWDLGRPHPELVDRLSGDPTLGTGSVGRAFVPGAGTGHDAAALAAAGWQVTAMDIAPAVEPVLARRLSAFDASVAIGDALSFAPDDPFDLVFDHTFFCALDPERRPDFGTMVDRVLGDRGDLVSIVFPLHKAPETGGPPWGFDAADVRATLPPAFDRIELAAEARVPGRNWPHRWARWSRDG